jgi:hypothetical protein
MWVIHREKLLKLLLSLSPSRIDIFVVSTEPCQVNTLRYKKNTQTQKTLKINPSKCTTHKTYIHAAYPEILTGAPNGEDREDQITYKLSKKKSYSQGCQLDLNLRPESWRLPRQIQSCLARRVIIMASLGPDWRHDKLVSVLWRTWFSASTQPILLRMGPQSLKVQPTLFWFVTLRFVRCSISRGPGFDDCPDVRRHCYWNVATVDKMAQHYITST